MRDDDIVGGGRGVRVQHSDERDTEQGADQLGEDEPVTEAGSMPAKVSVKIRLMVTAGLAKAVLEVNQYAAPM